MVNDTAAGRESYPWRIEIHVDTCTLRIIELCAHNMALACLCGHAQFHEQNRNKNKRSNKKAVKYCRLRIRAGGYWPMFMFLLF